MRLGKFLLFVVAATAVGATSPQTLLERAQHFADLYNWYAGEGLFRTSPATI